MALLLFVCVAASTMVIVERLHAFLPNDEGAIVFIDTVYAADGVEYGQISLDGSGFSSTGNSSNSSSTGNQTPSNGTVYTPSTGSTILPELETSDGEVVWEKDTQIEIFRTFYENENGEVTVQSSNGDRIIAPGTENSYTFKLKNTGRYAIDYNVDMESFLGAVATDIPIEVRISRFDGEWLVGSADEYVNLNDFHAVDSGTVAAGNYIYYTLDWRWPFESDDVVDTSLGDLTLEQEFSFSIELHTEATLNGDPEADGGLRPPQTGDENMTVLWAAVAVTSLVIIFLLLAARKNDEEEQEGSQMEEEKIEI